LPFAEDDAVFVYRGQFVEASGFRVGKEEGAVPKPEIPGVAEPFGIVGEIRLQPCGLAARGSEHDDAADAFFGDDAGDPNFIDGRRRGVEDAVSLGKQHRFLSGSVAEDDAVPMQFGGYADDAVPEVPRPIHTLPRPACPVSRLRLVLFDDRRRQIHVETVRGDKDAAAVA
jgi:hypothetical protein